jgi:hypothetical protein
VRTRGRRARGNSLHSPLRRGLRALAGGDLSRPGGMPGTGPCARLLSPWAGRHRHDGPWSHVTSSARDRRTVKSYLDMQVCLAYSYGPSSMSGLSDCSSLSAMVRRGVELAHGS